MSRLVARALFASCLGLAACDDAGTASPAADTAVGADTTLGSETTPEPPAEPDLANGQAIFTANCGSCHGADARSGSAGEDLPGKSEDAIRQAVRNGRSGMPSFGASQIDDAGLADLVAWIQSL